MRLFGYNISLGKVERDTSGNWSYWLKNDAFGNNHDFLKWALTNPVLFAVIHAKSKLYSQAEITVVDSKTGEVIKDAEELKLIENPNYFQSKQDWLYQQCFFLSATGNNLIYQVKPFSTQLPKALYNLVPTEVDYKDLLKVNNFITSSAEIKKYEEQFITYKLDNATKQIQVKDIIPLYDIANGLCRNTLMRSPSRLESLSKNLQNIDENLKAANISLKMSQKYIARNKNSYNGISGPIDEKDREAIENVISQKTLQITNGDIDVQHLISDLKKLYLSETFAHDATVIINGFGFNKDALNYALSGSTFENQNNGIIRVIQTEVQSTADNCMNSLTNGLLLNEKGRKFKATFNHLPVMQELLNSKLDTMEKLQQTIKTGKENGTIDDSTAKAMTEKLIKELAL